MTMDFGINIGERVTEDARAYVITRESQQNEKRSPRADPQGTLTFKGLVRGRDPAKKEQLEQNEAKGNWEARVTEEMFQEAEMLISSSLSCSGGGFSPETGLLTRG